jgi:glycosyltransferase involved in cell wall biosynthesis
VKPSLWFVCPAHGRYELTAICLRQLRRCCDALTTSGTDATAIVIADDDNLTTARELGFATYRRGNQWLSQKYNDGIQAALDPVFNPRPADYVVPIGSDDWIDSKALRDLPRGRAIHCFQHISFVREDGSELTTRHLNYRGGCGIRIYPRSVLEPLGFRPADEDRRRGCDTSILYNLGQPSDVDLRYVKIDPRQIVDWKSPGQQLNTYEAITLRYRRHAIVAYDPFEVLAGIYPAEALEEMQAHYARELVAA